VSDPDEPRADGDNLDHLEKVPELDDDQGFGGDPPRTYPGRDLEPERDEAPAVGWDPGGPAPRDVTGLAYRVENGFFTEIYGVPVEKVDCTDLPHTSFEGGQPRGIMWHLTAGCGENLRGVWVSKGFCGATLSIDTRGRIYQYLPLAVSGWHAFEASRRYWGIEHTGLPAACPATDVQLETSTRVFAALIVYAKRKWDLDIPTKRVRGCTLDPVGIKEHRDGAVPTHCAWDPNVHVDGLESHTHWTWPDYLARVDAVLAGEEDELDEKQARQLEQTADFTRGFVRGLLGMPPADDASDQERNAHEAGKKLARATGISGGGGGGGPREGGAPEA
jgi:N-acetylmuramoyl-L-alanine amidase